MNVFAFIKNLFKKNKKIGLALGSGGAKGIAHVGALTAFSEAGIRFDMVAGTSIGSIVGAMYCLGYTPQKMLKVIKDYNLSARISVIKMAIGKDSLENALNEILGDKNFSDTQVPFRAVACDLGSGEEIVMGSGSLKKALAASSAVPPVFRPVHRMGRKLVDGAFLNSVPCDVVRRLGADVVIGLSLHNYPNNDNLKRYADLLYPKNGIKKTDRLIQIRQADYAIYFPLDDYGASSVGAYNEIFEIGYQTTKRNVDKILKIIDG